MVSDPLLEARLDRVARRHSQLRFWSSLGGCWAIWACLGLSLVWLERQSGWGSWLALPIIALPGIVCALVVAIKARKLPVDVRRLAAQIESRFPELDGRLITAVQQQASTGGELNYLQNRLVSEALAHDQKHDWSAIVPESRINLARMGHWLALVLFLFVLWGLRVTGGHDLLARIPGSGSGITVTP